MYFKTFFKKTHLLILLMAMFMPWQARAQETLTVYDKSDVNQYIPMYGYYFDDFTKSECIIPATELTDMEGGTITAITFYAKTVATNNSTWGSANQKVFLKEVSSTNLGGSYSGMTDAAIVFDGLLPMPTTSTNGYTITFSELPDGFVYNGGNLLIGVYNDDDGSYNKVEWYGQGNLTSGVSAYGSNGSSITSVNYNAQAFLPKTTFTYTPAGGVGCAKPQNFDAIGITAHEASLTWTAGDAESNWDVYLTTDSEIVPDDNTTPTYQVTECSKALTELTAQTTYYAYVRANCGGDFSKWAKKIFSTTREALVIDQTHPYEQDFETSNDWEFTNGTLTNKWCWGNATNNGGEKAMYVSNDNGTSNAYTLNSTTTVFASKLLAFSEGAYTVSFDWKANGEANSAGTNHYDYLRVALVPGDVEFTAGSSLPSGVSYGALPSTWIALDGGHQLDLSANWQSQTAEAAVNGTYTMVFIWRNDSGSGNQPPAAIDNISISYMNCPRPTLNAATNVAGRTATLTWTENGTATNWVLQYAKNSTFTENLEEVNVTGTASKDLSGLTPETTYYARVKSVLGEESSSWSDVINFTTTATCPKPTLSYVSNSNTAYSGIVSWTGSTADAFEVAYRPTSDFDPSDYTLENVTRVQLENVTEYIYTLENLTPETKYYIYIQANCGSEDGLSSWSNRVIFSTQATCIAPSSLTLDLATSSTIALHWTKGDADQDTWQFRYKKTSESEYTYVLVENQSTSNYTLTGLEPSTEYKVNVRAWCSDTDQSKWCYADQTYDLTVSTDCGELTLPYTYGFEDNLLTTSPFSTSQPFPKCWNRIDSQSGYPGSYTYYPRVFNATYSNPYAHGGDGANSSTGHSLRMYQTSSSTNECAVMPAISSEYDMDKIQVRFWVAVQSSSGTFQVGIMENSSNASTFTSIQNVTVSNTYNNGFVEVTVPFSSYEGTGRYIAFMCGTGSSYAYFLIDDITVELIPTCWVPTALTVKETSYNSASLTWNAGKDESEWNLQYKKATATDWSAPIRVTTLPTNENPFVLTGLKRGTDYDVRVQAYCSADDQSEWCNSIDFTTDCGIWPIDNANALMEDFSDETFPPACWNWIRVGNNGWQRSVNIYNPIDVTGTAYSYWPSGDTYLILPQMHIDGTPKLTFDMVFQGDGSGQEALVVLSTTGYSALNFTTPLWEATEFPTNKTSVDIDLSTYNGQDVYIAFLYKGVGTGGRTWYIDNVQVYVADNVFTTEGEWTSSANWSNGEPTSTQSVHINAPVTIPEGTIVDVENITIGTGSLTIAEGGQLYHDNAVEVTLQKGIEGTPWKTRGVGGWYLIASPDGTVVDESFGGNYDLFIYNEPNAYWYSHSGAAAPFTTMNHGVGYLYASENTQTIGLTGEAYSTNEVLSVDLSYTGTLSDDVKGFNLVGNPFTHNLKLGNMTLAGGVLTQIYVMDENHSALKAENNSEYEIKPGEGFFVQATAENQTLAFQPITAKDKDSYNIGYIKIVAGNENGTDNAFIQFGAGNTLRKMNIAEKTKVYVMEDNGDDYAAARVEELAGSMLVNFKAAEDGEYTITVNAKNIEAHTMILFDDFTGETIDLLETPSYTFNASVNDSETRFKLIFDFNTYTGIGENYTNGNFAYQTGDEILVSGEGTLQVFDVMGRYVASYEINGSKRISTSLFNAGVYIFKMNGITQKVVVR